MAIQHLFGLLGASNFNGRALNLLEQAGTGAYTQTGGNAVSDPVPSNSNTNGSPWPYLAEILFDDYGILSDYRSRSVGGTGLVDFIDNGKSSTALVNIVSDLATLEASYVGGGDTVRKYVWPKFSGPDHQTTNDIGIGKQRQRYQDVIDYSLENNCGVVLCMSTSPRPDLADIDSSWNQDVGLEIMRDLAQTYRFQSNMLILTDLSRRMGETDSGRGQMFTDNLHWSTPQCISSARIWANDIARQLLPQGV